MDLKHSPAKLPTAQQEQQIQKLDLQTTILHLPKLNQDVPELTMKMKKQKALSILFLWYFWSTAFLLC